MADLAQLAMIVQQQQQQIQQLLQLQPQPPQLQPQPPQLQPQPPQPPAPKMKVKKAKQQAPPPPPAVRTDPPPSHVEANSVPLFFLFFPVFLALGNKGRGVGKNSYHKLKVAHWGEEIPSLDTAIWPGIPHISSWTIREITKVCTCTVNVLQAVAFKVEKSSGMTSASGWSKNELIATPGWSIATETASTVCFQNASLAACMACASRHGSGKRKWLRDDSIRQNPRPTDTTRSPPSRVARGGTEVASHSWPHTTPRVHSRARGGQTRRRGGGQRAKLTKKASRHRAQRPPRKAATQPKQRQRHHKPTPARRDKPRDKPAPAKP